MKEFIKSIINYLKFYFPAKHKSNEKYDLNKFQIYPEGVNYNKTMTEYCTKLLNEINFNINEASCGNMFCRRICNAIN